MEQNVWLDVCRAHGVPDAIAYEWLHKLMIKYSHENRHYYKWEFFNVKVNYLKNIPHHIVFAVFFQYYEVNVKQDCAKSNCDAFREFYKDSEIDDPNLLRYVLCLLGDNNHADLLNDIEEELQYFKDLDLLILGVPQKDYDEYTKLIQKEYGDMNENDYKIMRLKTSPCTKGDNPVASNNFPVLETNNVSKDESVIFIKDADDGDSDCEIIENGGNRNVIILDDDAGVNQTVTVNQIDIKHHEEESANNKTILITNSELFFKDTTAKDEFTHCLNQAVPLYIPLSNSHLCLEKCNSDIDCLRKGSVDLSYDSPLLTLGNSENEKANLTNISISDDSSWNKSVPEYIPLASNSINIIPSTVTLALSHNNNERQQMLPMNDIIDLTLYNGESPRPNHTTMTKVKNKAKKTTSRLNKCEKPQRNKIKSHRTNFVARSLQKSLSNNKGIDSLPQSVIDNRKKRLIIIDGSNVAFMHSCNNVFSVKGIEICLKYFEEKGFKAQAVVPQHRLKRTMSKNCDILHRLHKEHKIILTPCKKIPGKFSSSYDDRFILQIAAECNGVIISNDNYCDLMNENNTWKTIIETRVVGYTFFNDLFMLPDDPYGRDGPRLQTILYE